MRSIKKHVPLKRLNYSCSNKKENQIKKNEKKERIIHVK